VQVAQRRVGDGRIEDPGRQHFGAADDDAPFRVVGHLAIHHVAMAHRQDGLAILAFGQRQFQRLLVEQGDAGQVGICPVFGRHARHVAGTQERHRQAPGFDRAATAGQRQHQRRHVDLAVRIALHRADHARAMRFQQWSRRLQPAGRIVIAGDDDQVQMRRAFLGPLQETVELLLRRRRRIGVVKNISADEQRVGLFATTASSSQSRKRWCS
jgi:hypothetical protein